MNRPSISICMHWHVPPKYNSKAEECCCQSKAKETKDEERQGTRLISIFLDPEAEVKDATKDACCIDCRDLEVRGTAVHMLM